MRGFCGLVIVVKPTYRSGHEIIPPVYRGGYTRFPDRTQGFFLFSFLCGLNSTFRDCTDRTSGLRSPDEVDVKRQTSAPPHLTVWRQTRQRRSHTTGCFRTWSYSKHESFCSGLRHHVVPTHSNWTPDCPPPFTTTHALSLWYLGIWRRWSLENVVHTDKYETSDCSKISFEPFEKFILQIDREISRFVPKLFVPLVQNLVNRSKNGGGENEKKSQFC